MGFLITFCTFDVFDILGQFILYIADVWELFLVYWLLSVFVGSSPNHLEMCLALCGGDSLW